jgi:hypothetical protein
MIGRLRWRGERACSGVPSVCPRRRQKKATRKARPCAASSHCAEPGAPHPRAPPAHSTALGACTESCSRERVQGQGRQEKQLPLQARGVGETAYRSSTRRGRHRWAAAAAAQREPSWRGGASRDGPGSQHAALHRMRRARACRGLERGSAAASAARPPSCAAARRRARPRPSPTPKRSLRARAQPPARARRRALSYSRGSRLNPNTATVADESGSPLAPLESLLRAPCRATRGFRHQSPRRSRARTPRPPGQSASRERTSRPAFARPTPRSPPSPPARPPLLLLRGPALAASPPGGAWL